MRSHTNNWRKRQTEHRFYAEIETEITILDIYYFIAFTAGRLLVPEAMIRQGLSVSILAWLIKYLNVNIDHTRHSTKTNMQKSK